MPSATNEEIERLAERALDAWAVTRMVSPNDMRIAFDYHDRDSEGADGSLCDDLLEIADTLKVFAGSRPPLSDEGTCGCTSRCGDDGDVDGPGVCKGLPQPHQPLVELRLERR